MLWMVCDHHEDGRWPSSLRYIVHQSILSQHNKSWLPARLRTLPKIVIGEWITDHTVLLLAKTWTEPWAKGSSWTITTYYKNLMHLTKTKLSWAWHSSAPACVRLLLLMPPHCESSSRCHLSGIGTSVRRSSSHRWGVAVRAVDCWQWRSGH